MMKHSNLGGFLIIVVFLTCIYLLDSTENHQKTEKKNAEQPKSVFYASNVSFDKNSLTFDTLKPDGIVKHIFSSNANNLAITEIKNARDKDQYNEIEDYTHYVTVENGPHNSLVINIYDMQ